MKKGKRLPLKKKSTSARSNQLASDLQCQLGHPHADRCDGLHKAVNPDHQDELNLYIDFFEKRLQGEIEQHPLLDFLKESSPTVAWKCGLRNCAEDSGQRGVEILLDSADYTGAGSLYAYLLKILEREAVRNEGPLVRPPRRVKRKKNPANGTTEAPVPPLVMVDLDAKETETKRDLEDPRTLHVERVVLRRLVRNECMKQLLEKSKKSPLHNLAGELITECVHCLLSGGDDDDYDILVKQLTARGFSRRASKQFNTKISREKAARVLAEVGPIFHDWLTA